MRRLHLSTVGTTRLNALVSAALHPVIGRPLARPAVGVQGARRRAPGALALVVYDVFCLLSFGLSCPLRPHPAPPSSGPAVRTIGSGAPSSLISSGRLHVPGPSGGQGLRRAQLRKLRQQAKNNCESLRGWSGTSWQC